MCNCTFPDYVVQPTVVPGGGEGGAQVTTADQAGQLVTTAGVMTTGGIPSAGTNAGSAGSAGSGAVGTEAGAAGADGGQAGAAPEVFEEPSSGILEFSGQEIVTFPTPPTDDLTIELWLKTTQVGGLGPFYFGAALFDADRAGNQNDFGANLVQDSFAFGTGNPDTTALSQAVVNTGEWVHVAGVRVRASGIVRVLVNGHTESTLVSTNRGPLDAADPPSLGGHIINDVFYQSFTGSVDEVRLWNVARSEAEISQNMHKRLNGDEPGLVGYWRFDDGQGVTAADSSPSHASATLGDAQGMRVPTWAAYSP